MKANTVGKRKGALAIVELSYHQLHSHGLGDVGTGAMRGPAPTNPRPEAPKGRPGRTIKMRILLAQYNARRGLRLATGNDECCERNSAALHRAANTPELTLMAENRRNGWLVVEQLRVQTNGEQFKRFPLSPSFPTREKAEDEKHRFVPKHGGELVVLPISELWKRRSKPPRRRGSR